MKNFTAPLTSPSRPPFSLHFNCSTLYTFPFNVLQLHVRSVLGRWISDLSSSASFQFEHFMSAILLRSRIDRAPLHSPAHSTAPTPTQYNPNENKEMFRQIQISFAG